MSTHSKKSNSSTGRIEIRWIIENAEDFTTSLVKATEMALSGYLRYESKELAFERQADWLLGFIDTYADLEFPFLAECKIYMPNQLKKFPSTNSGKRKLKRYFDQTCITKTNCTPLTAIAKALLEQGDQLGAIKSMLNIQGGA